MRDDRTAWLMLVFLVLGVLGPASVVVWLINESVQRETTAAQHTLNAAYREQLRLIRGRVDGFWSERGRSLAQFQDAGAGGFQRIVSAGLADSAVIVDAAGVPVYPSVDPVAVPDPDVADLAARAGQKQVRDLVRSGERSAALDAIAKQFISGVAARGRDAEGRLIGADELLFAIHLAPRGDRRAAGFADRL